MIKQVNKLYLGDVFVKYGTKYRVFSISKTRILSYVYAGEFKEDSHKRVTKKLNNWKHLELGANSQERVEVVYSATR